MKQKLMLLGVISIPVVLFFIPMAWLEGAGTICLFKNIFGVECWGCGITRAIVSMAQLEPKKAIEYNWAVVIVFPIFCWVWIKWVIKISKFT